MRRIKQLIATYKANKKEWDNQDGYVQPIIPYWFYLAILSTPIVLFIVMVWHIATR